MTAASVALSLSAGLSAASAAPGNHPTGNRPVPNGTAPDTRPPGGYATWQALFTEQARLDQAAIRIIKAGKAALDSYTGVAADPTKRSVRVYVKDGKPTPQLAALITSLRRSVPITVEAAPYSKRQLDHAVQQVVALARQHKSPDIVRFSPDPAGQGLDVATTARTISATASELASIPVAIHYTSGVSRPTDLAPAPGFGPDKARNTTSWQRWEPRFAHYGGAPVAVEGFCTLGTPVSDGETGAAGYFTAQHCGVNGQMASSEAGVIIGPFNWVPSVVDKTGRWLNLDVATVSDNLAQPAVWDNDVDATKPDQPPTIEFTNAVEGTMDNIVGNLVATTGTYSGQRGHDNAIQIDSTDNYVNNDKGPGMQGPFVRAIDRNGLNAGGSGDSGAQVHVADPNDTTKVLALGILTKGDNATLPATCTGYLGDEPYRHCTTSIYYADIADALYASGLSVKTG